MELTRSTSGTGDGMYLGWILAEGGDLGEGKVSEFAGTGRLPPQFERAEKGREMRGTAAPY